MRPVTVLLLMLVSLLVLLPTVRIAYAQPIVRTLPTDPGPTGAHLSAELDPNGQDTWWVILMHDEQTAYAWTPVGCTGEKDGNVGRQVVSCVVTGLAMDHGYGDMIVACWGPDPMTCPNGAEADGVEVSWWTPLPANYATTTTTSASSIRTYTMVTNLLTVFSPSTTSQPTMTNVLTVFSPSTSQRPGPMFDFVLSVSPSTVSVVQGGTAHYAASVMYSDPSYAGTMINIQLTGLGPGMDYDLLQSGDLTVTTSLMTPTGSYSIVLTSSANGVTHQTGFTLIVNSAQSGTTAVITTIVPSTAPATITTPAVITTPTVAVTTVITQTATVQPSSTNTESSTSDVMSFLQQNSLLSLLIIGILVIALAAVLLSGRRRSASQVTQTQPQTTNVTYCSNCGTQNPITNSYCRKCGTKLS